LNLVGCGESELSIADQRAHIATCIHFEKLTLLEAKHERIEGAYDAANCPANNDEDRKPMRETSELIFKTTVKHAQAEIKRLEAHLKKLNETKWSS
jgi:hypothetical protein